MIASERGSVGVDRHRHGNVVTLAPPVEFCRGRVPESRGVFVGKGLIV